MTGHLLSVASTAETHVELLSGFSNELNKGLDGQIYAVALLWFEIMVWKFHDQFLFWLSDLFTWTLYGFLGSMVKFVQPAWQGEMYSMLFSPHTGLKALLGQEQLTPQDG